MVRSLFWNKLCGALVTVSVFSCDNFSSLRCRSTPAECVKPEPRLLDQLQCAVLAFVLQLCCCRDQGGSILHSRREVSGPTLLQVHTKGAAAGRAGAL